MPEEVLIEQASDGAATNATHTMVAATDYKAALENHERDELIVSASGAADVWVSLGTGAALVGTGIKVAASGPSEHIRGWKGEVHVISSGVPTLGLVETSFNVGDDEGEQPVGAAAFVPSGPSDNYYQRAVATSPDATAHNGSSGQRYPPNS